MERNYNAWPGYLTVNQAVDRIIRNLNEEDGEKTRGKYYRDLIKLSKENVLKHKKSGRNYWIDENDIDKYIQSKKGIIKYSKNNNELENKGNEIQIEEIKDIITLLEKAEVPPEKVLELLKEKLNMNNNVNRGENNG